MSIIQETGIPFPDAVPGQERYVISLPVYDDDTEQQHMRVQLIPVRYEAGDDGGKYVLAGEIVEKDLQGWGYTYWEVTAGEAVATHGNPQAVLKDSYIPLHDNPMMPYNSKVPIVAYLPEGCELRYKVWADQTGSKAQSAGASKSRRAVTNGDGSYRNDQGSNSNGYPTEDAVAAYPHGEASQLPHKPTALSAEEEGHGGDYPSNYNGQPRESAVENEDTVNGDSEKREVQVQDESSRVGAMSASEVQDVENGDHPAGEQTDEEAREAAKAARRKSKEKARQMEKKQASSSAVVPLSSVEEFPPKARGSYSGNIASPKRSGSNASGGRTGSTPRKGRDAKQDKYYEL